MTGIDELASNVWSIGQEIDLTGVGYGRIHWGNRADIKTVPSPYYYFLAGLVRHAELSRIVEIGTHCGGSAMAMASGFKEDVAKPQIVTIDVTAESDGYLNDSRIHKIEGDALTRTSMDRVFELVGSEPVDLLFVDGEHTYEGTVACVAQYVLCFGPRFVVLDDVALNDGMRDAWHVIQRCPGYTFIDVSRSVGGVRDPAVGFGFGVSKRVALQGVG